MTYSPSIVFLVGCLVGCAADKPPPATAEAHATEPATPPVEFSFETLSGKVIDSEATRGRATALLFVTTYDLASQVQAQRLQDVLRAHVPRANGLLVVLEEPEYALLAKAFEESLKLTLPVAMADEATRDGTGPFGPFPRVPTLVVLDRAGREVWRRAGLLTHDAIEKQLATASRQGN